MVLSAVGDAIGYRKGRWEFCMSGITMYDELQGMAGGINKICITKTDWPVSDDTLLHKATAEALTKHGKNNNKKDLYVKLAKKYVEYLGSRDMNHRHPGNMCLKACDHLSHALANKKQLVGPFDTKAGGSGAAMRSMCIGLLYPTQELLRDLVEVSVESGRLTHNHPTGYLGSLASALFTSYAVQGLPIEAWGKGLIETLDIAKNHVTESGIDVQENWNKIDYFENSWKAYLEKRGITDGKSKPIFPKSYGLYERDEFYRSISYDGFGGGSGHDAPMIAYDALLGSGKDWSELCLRAMIHGGDSDSTGVIAGALYGAMYGYEGVEKVNYEHVEFHDQMERLGKDLFELSKRKVGSETQID